MMRKICVDRVKIKKGKKGGKKRMSKAPLCEKLRECNHNRTKDSWI